MAFLKNLARMTVNTSGTGTITLNGAVAGFLTFDQAGCSTAATGSRITYCISQTADSEIGRGTYTSSALTLTRAPLNSTNGGAAIAMANTAHVFIMPAAEDLQTAPTATLFSAASSGSYTAPTDAIYLQVGIVGGGGGGSNVNGVTVGTSGATTTFASTITTISATGGQGGQFAAGGSGGIGSGGNVLSLTGGGGSAAMVMEVDGGLGGISASGGNSFFCGGSGTASFSSGFNGGGGSGGSVSGIAATGNRNGTGGGAGGYCEHVFDISTHGRSYTYVVGAGGAGSSNTALGSSGGTGGDGLIVIKEFYTG